MYSGHGRLSLAAFLHHYIDPDVTWENCRGCPLVMHYWVDLQSVHGFCRYAKIAPREIAIGAHDNIAANTKCQRVLVLALCLVYYWATLQH